MQKVKRIFFLLLYLSTALSFNSIAQSYFLKNYSVDDGLPFVQVSAIYQDSKGHLWTGGYGGLSKFDGYTFKNYSPENGLSNHSVTSINEDDQGNLWIGTIDGLNKFDGKEFIVYNTGHGLISNDITCVLKDSKNNFWLGTTDGLSKMANEAFTNYTLQSGLAGNKVKCLYEDRNKNIWIGTENGVSCFDGHKFRNYSIVHDLIGNTVNGIAQDSIGNMWFATSEGVSVLMNDKFKNYTLQQGLPDLNAKAVICDKRNNIWIGSDKGITKIHGTNLKNYALGKGMNSNLVFSICQDYEQNIWIGTYNGLYKYRSDLFEVYSEDEGLTDNFIFTITRDKENKIMVGTSGGEMYKMQGNSFVHCEHLPGQINDAYTNENGDILFGTGNGIFIYDGKTFNRDKKFNELIGESVNLFYKDSRNNLWIGCNDALFKYRHGEFKKYTLPSSAKSYQVWGIHEDKTGNLWVGTYLGGLFLFDGKSFKEQGKALGFKSESYFTILEDNEGIIYFSSFDGVYVYNTKTKKTDNFGKEEGISSELVYALAMNNEKTELWAGTNQGIDKIDIANYRTSGSKILKTYGKDEGFSGVECNTSGVYNDSDGAIWFGTVNGLIKYSPREDIKNNIPGMININSIRLFYNDTIFPEGTKLDYDMNNLSFNYSGICLTNPRKVRYSHILEGFDEKWSPVGYERTATYSNLPPGKYTFKVKCMNNEGVWTVAPASFSFFIKTPFWKTVWFYVLLSVIFIILLVILIHTRIKNIERKEKQKTELNKKIANIELQALRAQMNPHFIFNTMSSIQHYIANNHTDEALKYLAKFAKLMRSIIGNSKQQMISIAEELHAINLYLELEVMRFTDKFEYNVIVDEHIDQNYDRIPSMLIQPYVENAIAHGLLPKQGHGKIIIHLQRQGESILCTIQDNGIGREKSKEFKKNRIQQHKSMGMSITQERLDILNAGLNKNLNAQVFDLYEDGIPAGTKVQIMIPLETNK